MWWKIYKIALQKKKTLTICICCYDSNHHAQQSQQTQRSCPRLLTTLPSSIIYHSYCLIDLIKIVHRHTMYFLRTDKQQLKNNKDCRVFNTHIIPIVVLNPQTQGQQKTPTNSLCVGIRPAETEGLEIRVVHPGRWKAMNAAWFWRLLKLAYVRNFFIWKRLDWTWWKPRFPSLLLLMAWLTEQLWAGPRLISSWQQVLTGQWAWNLTFPFAKLKYDPTVCLLPHRIRLSSACFCGCSGGII